MIWSKQDPEKTPYHSQNPESWPLLLLFLTSYWSTVKSLRSSNSPRGGRGGQLFPQLLSKQTNRKPPSKRQFGKLTKSHRKFWTNWNVENLKPSVVVASCGVWGWGQAAEMGVMKDSALSTIFTTPSTFHVYTMQVRVCRQLQHHAQHVHYFAACCIVGLVCRD